MQYVHRVRKISLSIKIVYSRNAPLYLVPTLRSRLAPVCSVLISSLPE